MVDGINIVKLSNFVCLSFMFWKEMSTQMMEMENISFFKNLSVGVGLYSPKGRHNVSC